MSTPNDSRSGSESGDMELIDYFRILSKRRWLVGGGTIGLVFLVGIASLLLPKTYASSVDLIVTGPTTQVEFTAQGEPRIATEIQPKVSLDTYRDLLYSPYLAEEVVKKLGLDKGSDPITPTQLMDRVSVRAVPKTSLLRLTVEDRDAEQAQASAQAWAELFVEQDRELNRRELKVMGSIIDDRLEETGRELRAAEEALRRFEEREGIDQLRAQINNRISQIVQLEGRLKNLEVEEEKLRAMLKQSSSLLAAVKADGAARPSGTDKESLRFLQPNPSASGSQKAPLVVGSAESSQALVAIGLQERIIESQVSLSALEAEEKQSAKSVEELKRDLVALKRRLASEALEKKRLAQGVSSAQATFDVLAKKAEEVKVSLATRPGTVKVAVPAFAPERPVWPRPKLNVVIALAFGLLATTLLAFWLEYIERSPKVS